MIFAHYSSPRLFRFDQANVRFVDPTTPNAQPADMLHRTKAKDELPG
jgi:hypothetical protein